MLSVSTSVGGHASDMTLLSLSLVRGRVLASWPRRCARSERQRSYRGRSALRLIHELLQSTEHQQTINTMAKTRRNSSNKQSFRLDAPEAQSVLVAGTFTDWEQRPIPLQRDASDTWNVGVPLAAGQHQYLFMVDGEWRADPGCSTRVPNPYGTKNMLLEVV
jgi:hypothetical protein